MQARPLAVAAAAAAAAANMQYDAQQCSVYCAGGSAGGKEQNDVTSKKPRFLPSLLTFYPSSQKACVKFE
jgi:hypothetical protein